MKIGYLFMLEEKKMKKKNNLVSILSSIMIVEVTVLFRE